MRAFATDKYSARKGVWAYAQRFLLIACSSAVGSSLSAAPPTGTDSQNRQILLPNGLQIDLSSVQGLSDEELATALEQAAQRLRTHSASSENSTQRTSRVSEENTTERASRVSGGSDAQLDNPAVPEQQCVHPCETHWTWWDCLSHIEMLPGTLLFEPPLANPWSPRMFLKFTDLTEKHVNRSRVIDTAIGGELGLARQVWDPETNQVVQLDLFALALSRFADNSILVADDYRFGVPITFSYGNWAAKVAYEHTSTHPGDGFIRSTGQFKKAYIREELVLGLAYRFWEQFRTYGQLAWGGLSTPAANNDSIRSDLGLEWSRQQTTGLCGQPFAAFDLEMRADTDYFANTTLQIGWQWKNMESGHSLRTALEYYNGISPYGQFFQEKESWIGFAVLYDF